MADQYTCNTFTLKPRDPWSDLLIDDLGELGFDTFEETDDGFKAFSEQNISEVGLKEKIGPYQNDVQIIHEKSLIDKENWNQKWEESFDPVVVENKCLIRADFHTETQKYPYEIVLNPKMSFGTGHHQTTYLMMKFLLDLNVEGKSILDMGSGTGILAILAAQMKAEKVMAIDIEDWAFNNCEENIALNNVPTISVHKGDVELLSGHRFNVILANINKNVLLSDIKEYSEVLEENGILVMSGFYINDIEDIHKRAEAYNLNLLRSDTLDNWAALSFKK